MHDVVELTQAIKDYTDKEIAPIVNVYGAKNLIKYPYYREDSYTSSGVTYKVNSDYTIIADGTATSNSFYDLVPIRSASTHETNLEKGKKYILSGGVNADAYINISISNNDTGEISHYASAGDAVEFTVPDNYDYHILYCIVPNGKTVSNVIFKPMLRLASIADSTYVPYIPTNKALDENLKAFQSDQVNVYGSKNLNSYPYTSTTRTATGITFTDNGDGTVTADGTATADTYFNCHNRVQGTVNSLVLPNGKYIFTGCPNGGLDADGGYAIRLERTYNNTVSRLGIDTGSGALITLAGDDYSEDEVQLQINIVIRKNAVVSNLVFKPMLRAASIADDTWEPYVPTNKTLAASVNTNTASIATINSYLGLDNDGSILGVCVDYKNKSYTRLAAAAGLTEGTDFDKFPQYGNRRRCNLADDGTVNAYYGDTGYVEDGSNGQIMVEQPAFYYRVQPITLDKNTTTGIGYHIRKANYYVSHKPHPGFKLHPAFYDADGNAVDRIYISAYEACLYDTSASAYILDDDQVMDATVDKLSSIAGAKPASGKTQIFDKANQEKLAQNRGTIWHNDLIKVESANQLLALVEYGTWNLQATGKLGLGVVNIADSPNTENNSIVTGGTASLGNKSGMADGTNGKVSVSYRGMENPYGNIWKHVNGINIWGNGKMAGGEPYIAKGFEFDESKNTEPYDSVGFTATNATGYISSLGYGKEEYDWLFIGSETTGGSDALPVGDNEWVTANLNGYKVARLGGRWNDAARAGLLCWTLSNGPGDRGRNIGARLVCIKAQ